MENQPVILQTYRFTFNTNVAEELAIFAKVHQHDDRKTFKEQWTNWIKSENIEPILNEEIKRLTNNGFKGDVLDKMFKSTRYYFRTKITDQEKETKTRKEYESISKDIQEIMDEHIHSQINSQIKTKNDQKISTISPAKSFDLYLSENKNLFIEELKQNKQGKIIKEDCENLINKYKKTYKNRFYNIRVNLQKGKEFTL